jgi:uncharacterized membrane protein
LTAGLIILLAVALIIYFGFAHRALDRLRLNDRTALLFLIAMIVGGFLPDIPLGRSLSINVGGGIIPLILVGYLWSKADKPETSRSIVAVIITAAVVYATMKIMPLEPTYNFFLDPLYLIALIAGLLAYILSRSRRGAFIAGTLAIIINDLLARVENIFAGITAPVSIGGAGAFDAVVIAGFIALGLAELAGETLERVNLEISGERKNDEENSPDADENPAETENGPGEGDA